MLKFRSKYIFGLKRTFFRCFFEIKTDLSIFRQRFIILEKLTEISRVGG